MKVSSKIILGFLILMSLAIVLVGNQLWAIHQMQAANRELSEFNVGAAKTALHMTRLADFLLEYSQKYFASLDQRKLPEIAHDPLYERQVTGFRSDFLEDLAQLRRDATSAREKTQLAKLNEALEAFWNAFNALKEEKKAWAPEDLPPDFTLAVNHLQAQSEVMLDAVQVEMKERVASAAETGRNAERLTWIAGASSWSLGVIVSFIIVRSINRPLRRLVAGTKAIAKGHFWHRLPALGNDEFAELARDFNTMSERLGDLDQMKKDFVSHVSHDLKAPLASMRQIMHLLLQEIPGSLNEQQKSLIQLSYNSAERLAAMVGNLLDVSRMEAGTMEYRMAPQDILPLIKGVIDEFEVQAHQKEIRFRLESKQPSILVQCDRDRIVQVIGNLYENALKFSPSHTEVVTSAGFGKGGEILVSVSDSGPGVPDGHKDKIFQKFHQVKHGKKVAGQGVGLGLAICKTIVEAHRGQIWVEDNPAGGSVFSFVLRPATQEEARSCGQTA